VWFGAQRPLLANSLIDCSEDLARDAHGQLGRVRLELRHRLAAGGVHLGVGALLQFGQLGLAARAEVVRRLLRLRAGFLDHGIGILLRLHELALELLLRGLRARAGILGSLDLAEDLLVALVEALGDGGPHEQGQHDHGDQGHHDGGGQGQDLHAHRVRGVGGKQEHG